MDIGPIKSVLHLILAIPVFFQAWILPFGGRSVVDPFQLALQTPGDPPEPADLSLPDLQTLPPYDLRLILNPDAGRKWIRFSNSILNNGPGVLELAGKRDKSSGDILVHQNIYFGPNQIVQNEIGLFEFEESHNHWHYDSFSLYEVRQQNPDGTPGKVVASSGKVSYCVRDNDPIQAMDSELPVPTGAPEKPHYYACGWTLQGLSVGWVDTYWHNTPGQYVDISSLPNGDYVLVSTVDPENLLIETDESNNTAWLAFRLDDDEVVMGDGQVLQPQAEQQPVYLICQARGEQYSQENPSPRLRRPMLLQTCID